MSGDIILLFGSVTCPVFSASKFYFSQFPSLSRLVFLLYGTVVYSRRLCICSYEGTVYLKTFQFYCSSTYTDHNICTNSSFVRLKKKWKKHYRRKCRIKLQLKEKQFVPLYFFYVSPFHWNSFSLN